MIIQGDLTIIQNKLDYSSPSVYVMPIVYDILTGSYDDSNMGEWDTDDN